MMVVSKFIDIVLHVDTYLGSIILQYGIVTYGLLFLVIFVETGLVVMPFLPGDSLLFTAGAFAGLGVLRLWVLLLVLMAAAILGDTVNYGIGRYLGVRMFEKRHLIKKEYLEKTNEFYEKHGKKTIILARFVPIIRTFAPFVAGVGKMRYSEFLLFNVIGGVVWVSLFLLGGYFFGNLDVVRSHFSLFVLLIIFISLVPLVLEVMRHKVKKRQ